MRVKCIKNITDHHGMINFAEGLLYSVWMISGESIYINSKTTANIIKEDTFFQHFEIVDGPMMRFW